MRVTFQIGNVTIGQECSNVAGAFQFASDMAEVFGEKCGMPGCGSADVIPAVRKYGEKTIKKMECRKCGASIMLFSRDDGGMWFARNDKDDRKKRLPNNGWSVYKKDEKPSYQSQAEDKHPKDETGDGSVPF